jgi:hypothetical protein
LKRFSSSTVLWISSRPSLWVIVENPPFKIPYLWVVFETQFVFSGLSNKQRIQVWTTPGGKSIDGCLPGLYIDYKSGAGGESKVVVAEDISIM